MTPRTWPGAAVLGLAGVGCAVVWALAHHHSAPVVTDGSIGGLLDGVRPDPGPFAPFLVKLARLGTILVAAALVVLTILPGGRLVYARIERLPHEAADAKVDLQAGVICLVLVGVAFAVVSATT